MSEARNQPNCCKCGIVMTPENSRLKPEYFLCDSCVPPGVKQTSPEMKSPALQHIQSTAEQTPFGTPAGINKLPYVLWPAVAEMMEKYKDVRIAALKAERDQLRVELERVREALEQARAVVVQWRPVNNNPREFREGTLEMIDAALAPATPKE